MGMEGNDAPTDTSTLAIVKPGTILMYGGAAAPAGYLMCDGNSYAAATYPALFAVIGTSFGSGGAGFFDVPDFISYFVKGSDALIGGLEPVGFNGGTLRGQHAHPIGGGAPLITSIASAGAQPSGGVANTLTQRAHTHNVVGATDAGDAQPQYLCVNFIIKT
jgi:microcystin-dependent protein